MVKETPMPGYIVSDISPNSGTSISDVDLMSGTVKLTSGDRRIVTYTNERVATLKLCKVAGKGVSVGTTFEFDINGTQQTTLTAGPAPGGFFQIVDGDFVSGDEVTVTELAGSQFILEDILVAPEAGLTDVSLEDKRRTVTLSPGVTEMTFVNQANQYGYLEICKGEQRRAIPPLTYHPASRA